MWINKEAKTLAKKSLKSKYWTMVVVCVILMFLGVLYSSGGNISEMENISGKGTSSVTQSKAPSIVTYVTESLSGNNEAAVKTARGIVNSYKGRGGFLYGLFLKVDQMIISGSLLGKLIVIISILAFLAYFMFITDILYVGFCRMMMEMRCYKGTKGTRFLSIFKRKGFMNTVLAMLLFTAIVSAYLLLAFVPITAGLVVSTVMNKVVWPIIAGAILTVAAVVLLAYKYLGYYMVPYILAVDTTVKPRETLKLSKEMMNGNRKHLFGFFLSFIGWDLLNICTLGLLGVFFLTPYKYLATTEVFMKLREHAISDNLSYSYYLEDEYLTAPPEGMDTYPELSPQKENKLAKYVVDMDPTRKYSLVNILLMFFIFSAVGKGWEVLLHLVKDGEFINRGTMYGPWLPIYGAAGVLIIVLLRKLASKPALLFFVIMAVCGVMEYVTHWYIQKRTGIQYWNYSNYFLNLNGRIALEGLLVFAILGTFFIYIGAPFVDNILNKFSTKSKTIVLSILIVLFFIDKVYSHYHPKTGKGITDYKLKSKMSRLPDGGAMFDPDFNPALRILDRRV